MMYQELLTSNENKNKKVGWLDLCDSMWKTLTYIRNMFANQSD